MIPSGRRRLRVITFGQPLAAVAAQRLGLFEREGLEVEYALTHASTEQVRQLLAGDWDLAHTAVDNVMAYVDAENVDLFVFMVLELGLGQKLVLRPGLRSYDDLRGQDVGVDALTTGYAFVLRKMLALHGLAEGDYRLLSVGGTGERATALIEGHIAGTLLAPPHEERAVRAGCTLLDPAARYFPMYPSITGAATRRWAQEHRGELEAYVRALYAGERWAADPSNRDRAIELLAADRGVDRDRAARQYDLEEQDRGLALPSLAQTREAIGVVGRLRREMTGRADQPLDIERYFDPSFMQAAEASLQSAGNARA